MDEGWIITPENTPNYTQFNTRENTPNYTHRAPALRVAIEDWTKPRCLGLAHTKQHRVPWRGSETA
jgi:hypothetical protein